MYTGGPIESRIGLSNGTIFNDFERPLPRFQGHAILRRWISKKRYEIHSFNGILIGTYIRPTVSFRMTLSDLAKYSMTQSIAQPLCDSRATYSKRHGNISTGTP